MNKKILIFSGNSEADEIIVRFANAGISCTVSTAGSTGLEALRARLKRACADASVVEMRAGRMDEGEIRDFIRENKFDILIDGTHPFAEEASRNIKMAAQECGVLLFRLRREDAPLTGNCKNIRYFDGCGEAARYLARTEGNIFLTTGSKEIHEFTEAIDRERIFIRIIPDEDSIHRLKSYGIENSHIIAMQGVFSKELNQAFFKEFDIKILVTKDSGKNGGFGEKTAAAEEAGVFTCVIKRPSEAGTFLADEIFRKVSELSAGKKVTGEVRTEISLVGMGMGQAQTLTLEGMESCRNSDVIIASSERIIENNNFTGKEIYTEYNPDRILEIVEKVRKDCAEVGRDKIKITIAFSGDSGFYSGARSTGLKLKERGYSYRLLPGISSISMLSARSGIDWQDSFICSLHGREDDFIGAVREHNKVFLLLSDAAEINRICEELIDAGLFFIKITLGINLGSKEEKILVFDSSEYPGIHEKGISCCFIENRSAGGRRAAPGIKDDAFVRGNVPMTKEEVRALSICKLKLKTDSTVWDIGAGTGSVSVECAMLSPNIKVYAFERRDEACELIRENMLKAGIGNLEMIKGEAPEILSGIEAPDAVFIGGSGGKTEEIIKFLMHFEKHIQIVLNCVTIETVAEINSTLKKIPHEDENMIQLQVARAEKTGDYHIFKGMNPVYIISFRL